MATDKFVMDRAKEEFGKLSTEKKYKVSEALKILAALKGQPKPGFNPSTWTADECREMAKFLTPPEDVRQMLNDIIVED